MKSKQQVISRVQWILDIAQRMPGYSDISTAHGYAERGCSDPDCGIIALANWNPRSFDRKAHKSLRTMSRVADLLERLGVACEWSDEWNTCDDCGKIVRTSADCYSWQPSYARWGDACVCRDCLDRCADDYLEHLEGNDTSCVPFDLDMEQYGYRLLQDRFEHGLHHGQDADPRKIGAALRKIGVHRYVFKLDANGQFDSQFSVWVHGDEWDHLQAHMAEWQKANKRADLSPAAACQMAMADASRQMNQLRGEGVRVAKCNADGTATVKLVSAQDFIDGKALD